MKNRCLKPSKTTKQSWYVMVNCMVNCSWTWRKMDEHGRQVEILQTSSDPVVSIRSKVSGGFAGHPPGLADNTPVIRGSHTRPSRLVQKWSTLNPPKILQKSSKNPPKTYKPILSIIFLSNLPFWSISLYWRRSLPQRYEAVGRPCHQANLSEEPLPGDK